MQLTKVNGLDEFSFLRKRIEQFTTVQLLAIDLDDVGFMVDVSTRRKTILLGEKKAKISS